MNHFVVSVSLLTAAVTILALDHAAGQQFRYEAISVEQGLSQSSVWCSMQDSSGFLWFGTADGLNRYDGYTFKVFRHNASDSTSLSNNTVWSLLEDRSGKIWIGTLGGVDWYDKRTGTFSHLASQDRYKNTFVASYTRSMLEDRSGRIWFGTIAGLAVLDPRTGDLTQIPIDSDNATTASQPLAVLHEDDKGNIWYSWGGQLFSRDESTGKVTRVPVTQKDQRAALAKSIRDRDGAYWFVTSANGVFSFDPSGNKWRSYAHDPKDTLSIPDNGFRTLCEDDAGNIWFGSITQGLCYLDRATGGFHAFRPDDRKSKNARYEGVASILRDRSGLLWIGYDGAGLVKINPHKNKFPHFLLPPSGAAVTGDNFFKALIVDHLGEVWLGTYDQGIAVLDRRADQVRRYRHVESDTNSLRSNSIFALLEDRNRNIWVGTISGLDMFDRVKGHFVHWSNPGLRDPRDNIITALCEDATGTIWCGTATQLLTFDPIRNQLKVVFSTRDLVHLPITPGISMIAPSPDGSIWVGTLGGGLFKLRTDGSVERNFSRKRNEINTIAHNNVKTVAIEETGALWIGTEEGLNRYDPIKDQWNTYRVKDGLPNEFIYGLLLDKQQHLWISTNRGLSRMDIQDPDHPTFRNYTPDDGLQSYEFNTNVYFKTPGGEMFFGGVNGFNAFFPDSVNDNPVVPAVVLTGFKKFDQQFDLAGDFSTMSEIHLPYTESVFSFEFAALEYTDPTRNQYAYRMEGFRKDWVYCGNRREARYTNLDPGTYVFRVRGSNNDGVWNDHGASITVVIVPPFWRTWWFTGIVAVAGISAFGATVRFISVQKLRKRIRELEHEKAIQDERQKTRERIARDLHDDLASTVGSAGFFVESVKHQIPDAPSETKEFLDKTSSLLTEAEQAMSDIVWSVSPRHDTVESLLLRIRMTTADVCKASGMHYEVDCIAGDHLDLAQDVRRNIYLVFKEAITNAARHSGGTLVRVRAKADNGVFELSVCDDGKGLPAVPDGSSKRGHGLRNMRTRAEEIGAQFMLESTEGKGTTVCVRKRIAQTGH